MGQGGDAVEERTPATSPSDFVLSQNYPNPFNPRTTILFYLPEKGHVRLSFVNIRGNEIRTMAEGDFHSGPHEITFDAADLAAGVYLYKLETEKYAAVKKLAIVK